MVFNIIKLKYIPFFFILLITINYTCYCKDKYFVQVLDSITENYDSTINLPDTSANLFHAEIKTEINIGTQETEISDSSIIADSLFLFDGSIMLVDVKKFNYKYISYTYPGKMEMFDIDRRKVYKIIYKSGLVEIINTFEKEIPDSKDWKYILITESEDEINGYTKMGKVKGVSSNSKIEATNEELERSAVIMLKKQAAKLEADIVLITNRSYYRAYGEIPSTILKGIAYKMD
ncbi:MAG: hypothetical protein JXB17_09130 [Bacteroidales bacterium]|nr:hypothetical protein [Bacteroidales bacterium]